MLNINQPSQYGSELDDSLVEVYTWKTGKNPHSSLYQKKNTLGPVNYQLLEIDIVPEQIACGDEHVMFLTEEKLFAMGENSDGRLGISKRQVRSCNIPTLVHALSSFRVLKVACGAKHTIALVDPGDVFAWGCGADGQLGLRNDLTQFSPQYVKLDRTDLYTQVEEPSKAIDISCGLLHTAVVSKNGEIITFGNGEYGQLGNGKRAHEYIPYKVKLPNDKAEKVVCGKYHTVVLSTKGNIYAFGLNNQGQLGIGNRKNCDVPHRVSFPERVKITKISAGVHTAALTNMGQMYVWGPCILGECLTPQRVCRNVDLISDVQIAPNMTSILDFKGRLWTLGSHKPGELGVQSLDARTLGSQVRTLREKKVKSIVCARDLAFIVTEKGGQLCNSSYMTARGASLSPTMKDLNASITGRSFFAGGNDTSRDRDGNANTSGMSRSGNRSFSTGLIKGTTGILKGWRPTEKALEAFTISKSSIPTVHTTFHTEAQDMLLGADNFLSAEFKERHFEMSKERRQEYHEEREKKVMLPRVRDAALEEIVEHEHSTSAHEYASESERTHKLMMNYNQQQERELEGRSGDTKEAREVRDSRHQGGDLMDIVGKRESLREKFMGHSQQFSPIHHVDSAGTPHGGMKNLSSGDTVKTRELLQKQWSSGINGLNTDETLELERLISYNNSFNNTQEDQIFSKNGSAVAKSDWDKRRSSGIKSGDDEGSNDEYVTELKVSMEKLDPLSRGSREVSPGKNNKSPKGEKEKSPNRGRFASEQESSSSGQDKSPMSPTKKPPTGKKKTSKKSGDKSPQRTPKGQSSERRSESQERVEAYERKVQAELGNIKAKTVGTNIRADGKVGINEELFVGAEQSGKESYESKVQDQIRNYRNNNSLSAKRSSQSPASKRSSLSPSPKSKTSSPTRAKVSAGKKDSSSPKKKATEGKSQKKKSIATKGKGSEKEVSGASKKRNESTERKSQNSVSGKSSGRESSDKEIPGAAGNKSRKNESSERGSQQDSPNRRGYDRDLSEKELVSGGGTIAGNRNERRSQGSPHGRTSERDSSEQGNSRYKNESAERGSQQDSPNRRGYDRDLSEKEITSGGGVTAENRINKNESAERGSQQDSPNRRGYDRDLSEKELVSGGGATGNKNERRSQGSPHGRNYERDLSDRDVSPTRAAGAGGSKKISESNERRNQDRKSYEKGSFDKEATFGASGNNGNRSESYEKGSQNNVSGKSYERGSFDKETTFGKTRNYDNKNESYERRRDERDLEEQGYYESYERESQNNVEKNYERASSNKEIVSGGGVAVGNRINKNESQGSPNRRNYEGDLSEKEVTGGYKNESYERGSQNNVGKSYERGSSNKEIASGEGVAAGNRINQNGFYERRPQDSPNRRGYDGEFSGKEVISGGGVTAGNRINKNESYERGSQQDSPNRRGYDRELSEKEIISGGGVTAENRNNKNKSAERGSQQDSPNRRGYDGEFSGKEIVSGGGVTAENRINKNESYEKRSQGSPNGRSYERDFSDKDASPSRMVVTGGSKKFTESNERRSQNHMNGQRYERDSSEKGHYRNKNESYERRSFERDFSDKDASPTTAATGSKKINESIERRSQNTPHGRSYEREFSGKEMTPKEEAGTRNENNEFYERKAQNNRDFYEHEATPSMGNRRNQNNQGQYFEDQGEIYERRFIDEQGNVRSGSPGNQQRANQNEAGSFEREKRSFPQAQAQPQSQLQPPKGIVLGSNIRDPYNMQGNWQVSSVDRDSQRTGDFESSYRENPFESSSRNQPADLNRLTRKFDPVDAREYTPKGNYDEGVKNSSYLNTKPEGREPISFGDGNVGAVGANHGEVESLKYVGNGSQRNIEGSSTGSRKNIGGGSTPGSRKNIGSYPNSPTYQSRGDLDPNDIPRPFQKERSMSQRRAQADLMDAMAEDESFDIEVNDSFVRTHSNLVNRISDSPIPKRLNESRMSDIAMDLKTLKMKNSMIESQIEEKNRQIALLEGKVNEIDTYARLNEKKPSIILSRIDDQGLQFKISPHDTSHRPIPTMDISSIPYSYQDDTMIPTVTKIDAKIRIDSPGKEGPTDEFSIPSNVNEETPPSANGNKNDQNNILGDNGAQENKSLISMVNYMNQKGSRQDNYDDVETPKLRGEEPQNNAEQFGTMAQQRFNSPNLIASDNYQDSENDEALDNTLNLKSFKSSFSSWQVKNFLKEESVKNSAKERSTTFRTASPLGEFIIAPPPGYKTTKNKGTKSPNKSITKDKSVRTFSEQEESLAAKFKKAGKSSSMSYRPEEETKEEGGKKLTRNNSSTGVPKMKVGQSPANRKTKNKIANLKDSGIGSMPAPGTKGSKSGKLEIKGIFINPEIVKINEAALKGSPRPRMSDRSSRKDADDEDEDLGMFLKENAPEEEVRTAGIGKKKLVAKFKKNTGKDKSKIESEDGSRFMTNSEIRNSVKTQQSSFISNPPRSNENSPKQKKKAPSSIFSQVKSAKAFINSVENLAKNSLKKATTINESSMFLTDKISRIETKFYEPSDISSPKIPIPHGSPKDGTISLGSSPTHSRTPSKSKIGALARLLATSNEDGTGKTPKSALHTSTPKHFSDSYDTIGGYLAVHKK